MLRAPHPASMSEADPAGRTPPHNLEAERSLLGALLVDPIRVPEAAEMLQPEDFFDGRHGHLFRALLKLAEESAPIDFVTVAEELRAAGRLELLGGAQGLVALADEVTSSAHLLHHAGIVSDSATLRNLISEATSILGEAYGARPVGEVVQTLLDESEMRIFRVSRQRREETTEGIATLLTETFRLIDARSHRVGMTGLPTGFVDLDRMLSGLNKGEFVVIAGRPSMGKTAFALSLIENTAMSSPDWLGRAPNVLLFSLEMGRLSLVERMLCSRARVESHRLRMGTLSQEERDDLVSAADELRRTSVFIDDSPSLTLMAMRSRARRIQAQHGLDLVLVDYLQLLNCPGSENRQQEISSIARSLKSLARELDVPVVALAQLSRQVENRDPPRPQLSDLRESGSIEQDADVVMMLYRPEYYSQQRGVEEGQEDESLRGLAEVIVAKHRNGPTGSAKLQFFQNYTRFENRFEGVAEPIT